MVFFIVTAMETPQSYIYLLFEKYKIVYLLTKAAWRLPGMHELLLSDWSGDYVVHRLVAKPHTTSYVAGCFMACCILCFDGFP
jgi:hypothetical protein